MVLLLVATQAQANWPLQGDQHHFSVNILGTSSIKPGQSAKIAIELKAQPEWHSYFINPGDTGQATLFKWALPAQWQVGSIQWPIPLRVLTDDFVTYNYEGSTYFLTEVTAPKSASNGQAVDLQLHLNILGCHDVCIPEALDTSLHLNVSAQAESQTTALPSFVQVNQVKTSLENDRTTTWHIQSNHWTLTWPKKVSEHGPASARPNWRFYPRIANQVDEHIAQPFISTQDGQWQITLTSLKSTGPNELDGYLVDENTPANQRYGIAIHIAKPTK